MWTGIELCKKDFKYKKLQLKMPETRLMWNFMIWVSDFKLINDWINTHWYMWPNFVFFYASYKSGKNLNYTMHVKAEKNEFYCYQIDEIFQIVFSAARLTIYPQNNRRCVSLKMQVSH